MKVTKRSCHLDITTKTIIYSTFPGGFQFLSQKFTSNVLHWYHFGLTNLVKEDGGPYYDVQIYFSCNKHFKPPPTPTSTSTPRNKKVLMDNLDFRFDKDGLLLESHLTHHTWGAAF